MIQVFLSGPQALAFEERPLPAPGPTQVLVRVRATGICATDVHSYYGETIHGKVFPFHIGHEIAGVVEAAGAAVAGLVPGDRVVVDPLTVCGTCPACRAGRRNRCLNMRALGLTGPGGFSEYTVAEERNAIKFSGRGDPEMTFAEPLATVLHGLAQAGAKTGQRVLVQGAGTLGLLFAQALRASAGCSDISVGDLDAERLALAERCGAQALRLPAGAETERFDLVVDCTGNKAAVAGALPLLADGGTLLVFGVCGHGDEIPLKPFDVYRRELRVVGSFALNGDMPAAVRLLESGAVDVRPLIGGTIAPADLEKTIALLRAGKAKGRWIAVRGGAQGGKAE